MEHKKMLDAIQASEKALSELRITASETGWANVVTRDSGGSIRRYAAELGLFQSLLNDWAISVETELSK